MSIGQKEFQLKLEPKLPKGVNYMLGLYTKENSDLFIDDLSPEDLRRIADHLEYKLKH